MKLTNVQKGIAAGLAILVLGGSGYAITKQQEARAQAIAEQKRLDDQLDKATKSVETAEKSLKKEDIDAAAKLVEVVEDKDGKDKLTKRVDAARKAMAVKEQLEATESAVKNAETTQKRENVATAQAQVDKVTDKDKKAGFQARLEAVNQAIVAREAQEAEATRVAAEQAQAQQAAEQAQTTQSYSQSSDSGDYYSNQGQNTATNNPSGYTYQPQEGGGQPSGYGVPQYGTAEWQAWEAQQADQNTQWNQDASTKDYSTMFPGAFPNSGN